MRCCARQLLVVVDPRSVILKCVLPNLCACCWRPEVAGLYAQSSDLVASQRNNRRSLHVLPVVPPAAQQLPLAEAESHTVAKAECR